MRNLIIKYIYKITRDDINNFALKEGINLTTKELDYLYLFIKNDYELLFNNPDTFNIDNYKNQFSKENYPKIKKVFLEYFNKFRNYL